MNRNFQGQKGGEGHSRQRKQLEERPKVPKHVGRLGKGKLFSIAKANDSWGEWQENLTGLGFK